MTIIVSIKDIIEFVIIGLIIIGLIIVSNVVFFIYVYHDSRKK